MSAVFPLILEPDTFKSHLNDADVLIIDLCQAQNWEKLHLPGAVHISPGELVCGIPPAPGKLPSLEHLQALFSRIGYRPEQHIVVYDDEGGGWAGRFIWMLDVIGHSKYSYLNGGLYAWYKEQLPLTTEVKTPSPSAVELQINTEFTATLNEVMQSLDEPLVKIWDARSAEEFAGIKSSSARAGHIPGAFNLDWLDTMDKSNNLKLLDLETLRSILSDKGVGGEDRIITHCQSHHRSGLTYLAAKALGFKVQAYDGSWSEWGNMQDTPIEMTA